MTRIDPDVRSRIVVVHWSRPSGGTSYVAPNISGIGALLPEAGLDEVRALLGRFSV